MMSETANRIINMRTIYGLICYKNYDDSKYIITDTLFTSLDAAQENVDSLIGEYEYVEVTEFKLQE